MSDRVTLQASAVIKSPRSHGVRPRPASSLASRCNSKREFVKDEKASDVTGQLKLAVRSGDAALRKEAKAFPVRGDR